MFARLQQLKSCEGQSLVELIVAIAIFALIGTNIALLVVNGIQDVEASSRTDEATYLVEEGMEAVRSIRDTRWLDLTDGDHGLTDTNGYWEFSGTNEVVGDYLRTITVETVQRDANFDITTSGTIDPRTKKVTVAVEWGAKSVTASAYMTDWPRMDWRETSDAHFGAGTLDYTTISGAGDDASLRLATSVGGGGSGADAWIPGGGSSVTHDTNSDFSPGTFSDTVVYGSGTSARVQLDSSVRWTEYIAKGDVLDEMYDVDITGVSDGWGVGRDGTIVRQAGNVWYSVVSPVSVNLNGVFIIDDNEAWAVGDGGTLLRWDGVNWFQVDDLTNRDINGVSKYDNTHAWAVGDSGELFFFDGGVWTEEISPTSSSLYAVHTYSDTFAIAVGFRGEIIHWNGTSWSVVSSPTSADLYGVHVVSPTDAWAVGEGGEIIHWDGVSWTTGSIGTTNDLQDIYMTSATSGWAVVGEFAQQISEIWYYNGSTWTEAENPSNQPYFAIDFSGIYGAIVAGRRTVTAEGAVVETAGAGWQIQISPSLPSDFRDIEMSGPSFGLVVGTGGGSQLWNGMSWSDRPTPNGDALNSVTILSSLNAWAVGDKGQIIQWDGADWSDVSSGTTQALEGVDAVTASDIWACGAKSTIRHYNGTTWTSSSAPQNNKTLNDVGMASSSLGWIVGKSGLMWQWNGASWANISSPTSSNLNKIDVVDTSNAWAVGDGGEIIYWDGASWTTQTSPTSDDLESVHMLSSTFGWATGENGVVVQWDGVSWNTMTSSTGDDLFGVWTVATDDAWVAGQNGLILHYTTAFADSGTYLSPIIDSGDPTAVWNFVTWIEDIIGGTTNITIATRTGPTSTPDGSWSAWSAELTDDVGEVITSPANQYFQYRATFTTNDTSLNPRLDRISVTFNQPTTNDIFGVSLLSASEGLAVGATGTSANYNGTQWMNIGPVDTSNWNAVHMLSSTEAWTAADAGKIYFYDGAAWSTQTSPTSNNLHGVHMYSSTAGTIVGQSGVILSYDGATWSPATSPTANTLRDVVMTSATDGWAVGDGGTILQLSGGTWNTVTSPTTNDLYGIAYFSATQIWAVGATGTILEYDGATWSAVTSPTTEDLEDVDTVASGIAWAVGSNGEILEYNGIGWQVVNSPTISHLYDIDMSSSSDGWIVGEGGLFIHFTAGDEGSGYASNGTFTSQIFNSDSVNTEWQTLFWTEVVPVNTNITVAVRSGDVPTPDASWTSWSTEFDDGYGGDISAQTGQYLQYRVTMTSNDSAVTPEVQDVIVTYREL